MNLELTNYITNFHQNFKKYLRTDSEYFDLVLVPNQLIKKKDFIIHCEETIFLKSYMIPYIQNYDEFINNLKKIYDIFYNHLEKVINDKEIIITMIRFFIFSGYDRRIFTIFFEYHQKKQMFLFLLLASYFISLEDEYESYRMIIKHHYEKELLSLLNSDNFFFYYFNKNTFLNQEHSIKQIQNVYEKFKTLNSKIIEKEKKVILTNWLFLNYWSQRKFSYIYYLIKKIQKIEDFLFKEEFISYWKNKIHFIFQLNACIPIQVIKKEYKLSFSEYLQKFRYYTQNEETHSIQQKIIDLYNEFDFYNLKKILISNFEEIMMVGLNWNYLDSDAIWQIIREAHLNFYDKPTLNQIIYLFYKYRYKFFYFMGFEPFFQALFGLFYEKHRPYNSYQLYSYSRHPLVIYRNLTLIKSYLIKLLPDEERVLKKRVENLKKLFFMT